MNPFARLALNLKLTQTSLLARSADPDPPDSELTCGLVGSL